MLSAMLRVHNVFVVAKYVAIFCCILLYIYLCTALRTRAKCRPEYYERVRCAYGFKCARAAIYVQYSIDTHTGAYVRRAYKRAHNCVVHVCVSV